MPCLGAEPADDWQRFESAHLKNIRQVTKDFARAGEGYFSPDATHIIFQAEEKVGGNPFYQIFVMDCRPALPPHQPRRRPDHVQFFRPTARKSSSPAAISIPRPRSSDEEYRQREDDRPHGRHRRYQWDFDPYMDIFEADPDGSTCGG